MVGGGGGGGGGGALSCTKGVCLIEIKCRKLVQTNLIHFQLKL